MPLKKKRVVKYDGVSFGGGFGQQIFVKFCWWKPSHWFAEKRCNDYES